jgi:phospholipid-transporting ATPase
LGALAIFAGFSSLSVSSQIAPLLVVLAFSAAKEAVEDFNRFKADTHANNTPCTILKNKEKVVCSSQDIQPGQIVFVEKGQKFHTDIILLCSSYEDGTVFVETAELDGETNLKRKTSIALTQDYDIIGLSDFKGCIECESANENLLTFNGRLKEEKSSAAVALSMLNMAPRGAVLRNTDYVYGVVVYSGSDTKIMKNLKTSKLKSSKLEAQLNTFVLYAFVYNAILLVTSVILEYIRYVNIQKMEDPQRDELAVEWYLGFQMTNRGLHLWSTVVSFFTLYSYVIPISLFVSIELVRLGQATFMSWDPKMGYIRKNTDGTSQMILMRANNSNLNEELGNVNYIFSDKTGTLTQNLMKLDKWFIEGYTLEEMQTPGIIYQHLQVVF